MVKIVKYAIAAALLLVISTALCAQTYKWVNENGVVTYSQTPPPDRQAEEVKLRDTGPGNHEDPKARLDRLRQKMADSAEDRELAKQQRQADKEERELKRQNCEAARTNLRHLQGLGSRLYKMDNEYRRLSEEERQALMQKEKEHIKANCGK
jgi:hypothetical protein